MNDERLSRRVLAGTLGLDRKRVHGVLQPAIAGYPLSRRVLAGMLGVRLTVPVESEAPQTTKTPSTNGWPTKGIGGRTTDTVSSSVSRTHDGADKSKIAVAALTMRADSIRVGMSFTFDAGRRAIGRSHRRALGYDKRIRWHLDYALDAYLARNLALAKDLAGALQADAAVNLNRTLFAMKRSLRNFESVRGLDPDIDPLLEGTNTFELVQQRAAVRNNDLYAARRSTSDLSPDLRRDLMTDFVSTRDTAVRLAAGLEDVLDSKPDRFRASLRIVNNLVSDLAGELNRQLKNWLDAIPLDVSGADLSRLDLSDFQALAGTVWSEETVWPPALAVYVRVHSEPIGDGVYRIQKVDVPSR